MKQKLLDFNTIKPTKFIHVNESFEPYTKESAEFWLIYVVMTLRDLFPYDFDEDTAGYETFAPQLIIKYFPNIYENYLEEDLTDEDKEIIYIFNKARETWLEYESVGGDDNEKV